MMGYESILVAGIAFAINEQFDKILLVKLPSSLLQSLKSLFSLLQTWFVHGFVQNAHVLGLSCSSVIPIKNAPQTYATVTIFVILIVHFIVSDCFCHLFKPS
jgi:hypothetical protein